MKHDFLRLIGVLLLVISGWVSADVVNVYSARHYDTDITLYDTFTDQTGIQVNLIEGGSDALIERIRNEGKYSPADVLITVDAGRLWRAQDKGVFQAVDSQILNERIPAHLREPNGHWFGLSKRARVIVYNRDKGLPLELETYEQLTDPGLKGQICMRSSSNIYNLSLLASMIDANGEPAAQQWATGVVANFSRSAQGNDTSNLAAVASGECGLTIANTYYMGRWLASDNPQTRKVMEQLAVVFPNQEGRGTHVNVSGAGVTAHAPNRANAIKFIEYLASDFAQSLFAEGNNEYPVVGETRGPITQLGSQFKEDQINAAILGKNQAQAVRMYDRAGWR
ncbi:MAG: Fe(3+) ABC transporter substrate-binding protein [Pseudomonadota bacterium]